MNHTHSSLGKRPRLDNDVAEPVEIVRSSLWKDDGNLVLHAGNTQFRVHRSMLVDHSVVFKDMFSLCTPESPGAVDNCPIISPDDSSEDLFHVLMTLYDWRYFRQAEYQPLPKLSALLRLGRKYAFDEIRLEAVKLLKVMFPTTLRLYGAKASEYRLTSASKSFLLEAANLAREADVEVILPFIFYQLASADPAILFERMKTPDGTYTHCSAEDLKTIVLGRHQLIYAQAFDRTLRWFTYWIDSDSCTGGGKCSEAIRSNYYDVAGDFQVHLKLLAQWDADWVEGVCEQCSFRAVLNFDKHNPHRAFASAYEHWKPEMR